MTSSANVGAERPQEQTAEAPPGREHAPVSEQRHGGGEALPSDHHDPQAKELLRRYLSEIHSYRELGNVALRDLEKRLATLSSGKVARDTAESAAPSAQHAAPASHPERPEGDETDSGGSSSASLSQRLRELSAYLHEDLSRQQRTRAEAETAETAKASPKEAAKAAPPSSAAGTVKHDHPQTDNIHKLTPNSPVLDRSWFEDRFAAMRASIDQLAEQIPTQRIEALEQQFQKLMDKLEAREKQRPMEAVEAGLKKLAAYLEDNKQWTKAQDARVRGVEERLDRLSGLVAQSHAALSQTAKGLELVARNAGPKLAEQAAEKVAEKLEPRLADLDQKEPIVVLTSEVAKLSAQSKYFARNTDERIKRLQTSLDESMERLETDYDAGVARGSQDDWRREAADDAVDDDYDGRMIAAARRAARLAEGPARDSAQDGEPLRYQIPYGEFLPEDERDGSRIGLVIAAVILLLASAAMLYLNLRDWNSRDSLTSAWFSENVTETKADSGKGEPFTVASVKTVMIEPEKAAKPESSTSGKAVLATATPEEKKLELAGTAAPRDTAPRKMPDQLQTASIREAAVDGDAAAQFSVGETYLKDKQAGDDLAVSERLSKAARWFRRAAEKGHAPSQYRLATLYEVGKGAPKDHAEAIVWYEKAAEQGHVKAMHNLAVLSISGEGVNADYAKAAKWFGSAAEHGLRDSQYNIAVLYERGLGVDRDPAKAYRWFALAAEQGDAQALERRKALADTLSNDELSREDRALLAWTAVEQDAESNMPAPEPPVQSARKQPAIKPEDTPGQLMTTGWSPQVATMDRIVAEAQRLLNRLGYPAGPVDGIPGPRTTAAVRAFEEKAGLPATGKVTDALVAKMAFAL